MKKIYLLSSIILAINLNASNVDENKGKVENNERGFAFYENNKKIEKPVDYAVNKVEPNNRDNQEIVLLLKKILEVNIEIRDILKKEYDPQPKTITNEKGEKCVANSSADCFEMPITNEAKKVPVYKEWLEKGDMQSSLRKKGLIKKNSG